MKDENSIFTGDKILKHLERVAEWQKTGDAKPINWTLSLTNRCNGNCPNCYGWVGPDGKKDMSTIPFKKVKDIINQIAKLGGRAILVTGGGEPTLHPECMKIIKYIKSKGMDVSLATNGLLLHKLDLKTLLDNATWCRISLDAGTPEMYKKTHGLSEDKFNQVIENIRLLTKKKKELGSRCTVGVGYLTGEETLRGMEDYARLSSQLEVDYATFRPFHWDTTPIDKQLKKAEKYETKEFRILSSKQKYEFTKERKMKKPYTQCLCHYFFGEISANGGVYLCYHLSGSPGHCFGNLYEKSLKQIWNSKERKQAIRNLNIKECAPFCRGDAINRIMWEISRPRDHVNFI
ncbi:MAG: radical SAM protein [Nanoarchaeota archaeon]|nr:radical SAM protein [Nanoarchaeota archaeon]